MQFTKKNMASSQTWCETKTGIYFVDMVCPEFFLVLSSLSYQMSVGYLDCHPPARCLVAGILGQLKAE